MADPISLIIGRAVASLTVPGGQEFRFKFPHFFPQISINFSYFFPSNLTYFLPHFGPPGGRVAHPGRHWLRHCLKKTNLCLMSASYRTHPFRMPKDEPCSRLCMLFYFVPIHGRRGPGRRTKDKISCIQKLFGYSEKMISTKMPLPHWLRTAVCGEI